MKMNYKDMTWGEIKEVAREKAMPIYETFQDIRKLSLYHKMNGVVCFFVSKPTKIDCEITPNDNGTYHILFYNQHNMYQRTILKEIDKVELEDLKLTFINVTDFLGKEWERWNKDIWKGSWWGYGEMVRTI